MKQTLLGKTTIAGSTFIKKEGIDKTASKRETEYKQLTSWNERILHKYYLTKGGLLNEKLTNIFILFIAYILPFKHESFIHYLFKLTRTGRLIYIDGKDLRSRLSEGAKRRKYFLSGSI